VIYGVGIDIVEIARIESGMERFGDKYAQRILADAELLEMARVINPAQFLAKRFAAKEAVVKAMGVGFTEGIAMTQIVVGHDDRGKPLIEFSGRADEVRKSLGIGKSHISISDERHYAIAFVALQRET
jgi:holo-[acyl-carrier protein] synthase